MLQRDFGYQDKFLLEKEAAGNQEPGDTEGLQKQQRRWLSRCGYPGGQLVSLVQSLLS